MSEVLLGQSYYLRFDPKLWQAMQPYPPLGTLYAASYLRQRGYDVALYDAYHLKIPVVKIEDGRLGTLEAPIDEADLRAAFEIARRAYPVGMTNMSVLPSAPNSSSDTGRLVKKDSPKSPTRKRCSECDCPRNRESARSMMIGL